MTDKSGWGGPRTPGPGKKIGRKPRDEPKSYPIWCGQISQEQRQLILDTLDAEERYLALLDAARRKLLDGKV